MMKPGLKVALVCDWLTTMGGAERVILELHEIFPEAPIYTSSYSPERMPLFKDADVRTGFIQKLPFSGKHQLWPVLRRFYFGNLKLKGYDLVISLSGAEAKAVQAPNGIHINYCFSPTHYYWVRPDEYLAAKTGGGIGILNPIWRFGLMLLKPWMKRWDYLAAQSPDYIITLSTEVQKRIKQYYNRDSVIIYPPVDIDRFTPKKTPPERNGYLIVGRQVHHKRFDLAVKACTELNLALRVIGNGPEHDYLKSIAGPTVEFLTAVDDNEIAGYFQSAEGYIFPQEDDFGIVAVEAMAAGTPVIAFSAGGSLDTVIEGKTGVFFHKQSTKSLQEALESFSEIKWNHEEIIESTDKFSTKQFENKLEGYISELYN